MDFIKGILMMLILPILIVGYGITWFGEQLANAVDGDYDKEEEQPNQVYEAKTLVAMDQFDDGTSEAIKLVFHFADSSRVDMIFINKQQLSEFVHALRKQLI